MSDRLLQVGVSSLHGDGSQRSHGDAAVDLVTNALMTINTLRWPVRCAFLFATSDWCGADEPLSRCIRDELESRLGYRPPLIGCSAPEIYCSTDPEPYIHLGEHFPIVE